MTANDSIVEGKKLSQRDNCVGKNQIKKKKHGVEIRGIFDLLKMVNIIIRRESFDTFMCLCTSHLHQPSKLLKNLSNQ